MPDDCASEGAPDPRRAPDGLLLEGRARPRRRHRPDVAAAAARQVRASHNHSLNQQCFVSLL